MDTTQTDSLDLSAFFHPSPVIEQVALGSGQHCHVVDNALVEPERFLDWVLANREHFKAVDFNVYPGTYLPVPVRVSEALQTFFLKHIRVMFDARRLLHMHSRLAMVTVPPQQLRPCQWFCHSDNFGLAPTQSIQASVLYLFKDDRLGGTSFYEPTRSPQLTQQLFAHSTTLSPPAFTARYGIQPGYMRASNDYFRQLGSVPARWNRMIFYDASMLHTGQIDAPERLSADPASGRLTYNGFFTSQRHSR